MIVSFKTAFSGQANLAVGNSVGGIAAQTLVTSVLLVGFIRREKKGMANVGIESSLVMGIYLASVLLVFLGREAF